MTRRLRFKKLDAFATAGSQGNPAAGIYLDAPGDLTGDEMQRVARELQGFVSEVGFLSPVGATTFEMRYFSAVKEVAFCGHATIAIFYELMKSPTFAEVPRLFVRTAKGMLSVENRLREEDAVQVEAPAGVHRECSRGLSDICAALDLSEEAVDRSTPLGVVDAGNRTLCLPLSRLEDVLALAPDMRRLRAFCDGADLDVITVFTTRTADPLNHLRSRVFAAPFGYLEDPATGSGNAALGYHLHKVGQWDGTPLRIEQNASLEHSNLVRLSSRLAPDFRVSFGGAAILRIDGEYCL